MLPPFIPKDAKWYLAEIVEEIQIQDEQENIIHINFVLVRADSPPEAYEKALELGEIGVGSYQNTHGKTVTTSFRGLHNLHVIHDDLEHGSEILYERKEALSEEEVRKLVRPREELNIFKLRRA